MQYIKITLKLTYIFKNWLTLKCMKIVIYLTHTATTSWQMYHSYHTRWHHLYHKIHTRWYHLYCITFTPDDTTDHHIPEMSDGWWCILFSWISVTIWLCEAQLWTIGASSSPESSCLESSSVPSLLVFRKVLWF